MEYLNVENACMEKTSDLSSVLIFTRAKRGADLLRPALIPLPILSA